jgi:hypothetical protein
MKFSLRLNPSASDGGLRLQHSVGVSALIARGSRCFVLISKES